MSDVNLLVFGCAVSFIAAAGGYVYLRDCWTAAELSSEPQERPVEVDPKGLRDVA